MNLPLFVGLEKYHSMHSSIRSRAAGKGELQGGQWMSEEDQM